MYNEEEERGRYNSFLSVYLTNFSSYFPGESVDKTRHKLLLMGEIYKYGFMSRLANILGPASWELDVV